MKAKTKVQFQPLMDRTPSDPSSTYLNCYDRRRRSYNQSRPRSNCIHCRPAVVSCYVGYHVVGPTAVVKIRSKDWVHALSYIGCIGVLMNNTGLSEVMKSAFSGVEKMLLGKKFPMNVRALRLSV